MENGIYPIETAGDSKEVSAAPVLKDILEIEEIDVNVFRGWSPAEPRWGRVYGGQTVSQAIVSAQRTVDSSKFAIHSIHSYFLRAGDDDAAILYYVDNLKDSPSFCARRVVAVQNGIPIFTCAVNFCSAEKVPLEHQTPMPDVPHPDTLPLINTRMRELAQDVRLPIRTRKMLARSAVQPIPFDIKWTNEEDGSWEAWSTTPPLRAPHRCAWMRVRGRLPNRPTVHHVALAYLSDWGIIGVATKAHGLISYDPNVMPSSLDHTIYFHDPNFRADEWLLYDVSCERMKGSRCLLIGKVFTQEGVHVVTVIQEALIRVRDPVAAAFSPSPAIQQILADPGSTLGGAVAKTAPPADAPGTKAFTAAPGAYVVKTPAAEGAAAKEQSGAFTNVQTREKIAELRLQATQRLDSSSAAEYESEAARKAADAEKAGNSGKKSMVYPVSGAYVPTLSGGHYTPSLPLVLPSNGNGNGKSGNGEGSTAAAREPSKPLSSNTTAGPTHSSAPLPMPQSLPRSGPHPWDKPIIVALL